TTVLSHEIERWTSGGQSFVWVKVPKVDKSSTTDFIWMYYGNPAAADGQSVAAVWSGGHRAVWHLGATGGTDSTGVRHTGTDVGGSAVQRDEGGGGGGERGGHLVGGGGELRAEGVGAAAGGSGGVDGDRDEVAGGGAVVRGVAQHRRSVGGGRSDEPDGGRSG